MTTAAASSVPHPTTADDLPDRPLSGYGAALLGREEIEMVTEVLNNKRPFRYYGATFDVGPGFADKLEEEFASMMGTRYALAVTSGSGALEVALGALGVGPGDEVIIPAWSWVSCFTAVAHLGARPVLAEINETFCLDPAEIDRLSTPRTKAVMVIHYQGAAAEMDEIMAPARRNGIAVIEDCAEAAGTFYKGRRVGSIGDLGIFSFQANKMMTSGEGGAVITDNPSLYERSVRMHDLGSMRPQHANRVKPAHEAFAGSQFRMNEVTAAVALAQLRKLDAIREHCIAISKVIRDAVAEIPGAKLRRLPDAEGESGIETYFWMPTTGAATQLREFLEARNVNCQRMTGTYCQYNREYCKNRRTHSEFSPFGDEPEWPAKGYRAEDFPKTEALIRTFIAIPAGCYYTKEDAGHIARSLRQAAKELSGLAG